MSTTSLSPTKKKLVAVMAGLLAFGGVSTITSNAFAAPNDSSDAKVTLAAIDNDTVIASGRNLIANKDYRVSADSASLSGSGTLKTDGDGRFLAAFRLPVGFDETLKVSVDSSNSASDSIKVKVEGNRNDDKNDGEKSLAKVPGGNEFIAAQQEFNKAIATGNNKITAMNAAIKAAPADKQQAVAGDVTNLNNKLKALNEATKANEANAKTVADKARAAKNQAELDALKDQVAKLVADDKARIAQANEISALADSVVAKLKTV